MDHLRIEEESVAERYLLGRLSPEEAELFEEHYLECPECLERLELGQRWRDGLRDMVAAESTYLVQTGFLAWLSRRGPTLRGALAAVLVVAVALPWAVLGPEVARLGGELERTLSPRLDTAVVSLSPERSGTAAEPSTRITLGPTPGWVHLQLALPPATIPSGESPGRYRVSLAAERGEILWQSERLEPDGGPLMVLRLHSSWLTAPTYYATLDALEPGGASRPVARFGFRVRRE